MYVVGMNALKCRERDKNAGIFTKPGQISNLALLCIQMRIIT